MSDIPKSNISFSLSYGGKTYFYATLAEAQKMAKFIGIPERNIKQVSIR